MSILTSAASAVSHGFAVPHDYIWRLSVPQYHAMIQAGILGEDDPIELLEGWLVVKMPKNPPHRTVTGLLRAALESLIAAGWYVDSQEPVTLSDSEPEPDLVVVRGERRQYLDRHPGARDLSLIGEVSDSTLQRDRTFKKRLYAGAAILVYWIVNLVDQQVEVYTEPFGAGDSADYRQRQDFRPGDTIPVFLDEQEIGRIIVADILP